MQGLGEELISVIIIRSVIDPNIRATATNAKLFPNDLVEFFSIYVKPNTISVSRQLYSRSEL